MSRLEKRMEANLQSLFTNALRNGIPQNQLQRISRVENSIKPKYTTKPVNKKYYMMIFSIICVLLAAGIPQEHYGQPLQYLNALFKVRVFDPFGKCWLHPSYTTYDLMRPIAKCDVYRNLSEVPIVQNMTRQHFLQNFAYTGTPVLIKGGAATWPALNTFSYKYFKRLYTDMNAFEDFETYRCQFFEYKTNLRSLRDVFKMSKRRAALKKDQWYIGWSNCLPRIQTILRRHYQRPAFLPVDSESSSLDWIFMGGSGRGAMMHIDAVNRPSWQAMIKGKKTWTIQPPPECLLHSSKRLQVTMEPGDILVVDTNKWYHSTYIHPEGGLAITIGSEYD
uniref:Cupin like domain containing protein n=1 Tax=Clytia hemisphaerica TaxID=252671 RepID=A0A069DMI1_9CNID